MAESAETVACLPVRWFNRCVETWYRQSWPSLQQHHTCSPDKASQPRRLNLLETWEPRIVCNKPSELNQTPRCVASEVSLQRNPGTRVIPRINVNIQARGISGH